MEGEVRGLYHEKKKSNFKLVAGHLQAPWARSRCYLQGGFDQQSFQSPRSESLSDEECGPACDTPSSRCSPCQAAFIVTLDRRPQEQPLTGSPDPKPGSPNRSDARAALVHASKCSAKKVR